MTKHDNQQEQPQTLNTAELDTVTGGILPLVAAGIGAAATVGFGIWKAGHDKGIENSNCS
jgi:lactobin A/cerein 7B family class IIb bacteriocin